MSLEALDVTYATLGGRAILNGITLRLRAGTVTGLGGPSGAGKSTLARVLAGHLRPTGGEVRVNGGTPGQTDRARPVQYAPQSAELATDPRWTVERILANGGAPDTRTLDALGIRPGWRTRRPAELSGGELQRVSLARLLGPATRFLVCDEITAQLDPLSERILWTELLGITSARGIGVLVISHDAILRQRLTDRNFELADGRIVG
jgi:peptide/nickel transport system ATP-binding protein